MGNIASINFKQTKNAVQLNHNDRSIPPNYILPSEAILKAGGGVEVNRAAQEALALRERIVSKAMQDYSQHRGQRFRAKSYLWSAVVNLKETSTMQDLEQLAKHFKDKYGFQCYQIAIHRDEGHIDENDEVKINHHAHLEFVTLDENTGKSLFRKTTPLILKQMQTDTAQILGMQRGEYKNDHIDENANLIKGTGRKRIEPRAYGQLMEKEKAKRIALDKSNTQEVTAYKEQIESLTTSAKNTQTELHTLKQENTNLEQANTTLQQANTTLQQANQELKDSNTALKATLIDLTTLPAPQGKKLTTKEVKTLASDVRKQMIAINQGLGEHKLFTQQDYMAVRALIEKGLTFESFSDAITQIELEAKERYDEALKNREHELNLAYNQALETRKQELRLEYTKELEAKEKEHTQALEAKDTEHAKAINSLKEQHTTTLKQAQEANEKLNQENQALEAKQQSLTQELKNSKQEITTLKVTNQELQQENQALKIKNTSLEHTLEHNNNIERFVEKGLSLINTYLKPLSEEVHAIIQENDEKLMSIYQQCQEEMIQQASVCVVLGEELKAGKFKAWNKVESLFGKWSKDSIPFEYVERGKVHYREFNRREQSIKKDLADTLKNHSQKLQSTNDNAYNRVSGTMDDVCCAIEKLITEFKNSAEYGAELNQAKEQINTLEYNQKKLQNQVSQLKQERENSRQEVEKAKKNNEALRQKNIENAGLKASLKTAEEELSSIKTELENTKAKLESTQSGLDSLETLRGTIYGTIHQISEINPEMAQELKIKASTALADLARLKEELPQTLAWAKEQKQKGSGGYHK
ncbi:hypothetical protein NHP200010_04170 [Helicobacter bizzozeronii]|uniref:hypothetical protein n=1 Tax=Helicobacter bizzozeronii TaxID=56877 RepID=UPI00244D967A|nr:hypothetical protein [Helicobacter bizzozeronii]GMB92706.1 hypothetical protein NHP200010_04170 [Helicobacter bizzozeronii]